MDRLKVSLSRILFGEFLVQGPLQPKTNIDCLERLWWQLAPFLQFFLSIAISCSHLLYFWRQVHSILDEIVMGGQVVETNSAEVMKAVQDIWK